MIRHAGPPAGGLASQCFEQTADGKASTRMSDWGIGASVPRKEDERFLTGRGQYVADFRIPGLREVAFVRSPVAHGRLRAVNVPDAHRGAVFSTVDLVGV